MRLDPRYDGPQLLRADEPPGAPLAPVVRQRRRFAELLAGLDDAQWLAPSRCDGWSVRDVAAHLVTVNSFWDASIAAGAAGAPTRMLAGFDPVESPPRYVASMADLSAGEVLDAFVASNDALVARLEGLSDEEWAGVAEAPVGLLPIGLVAQHALWDSWVHERDVAVPLGLTTAVEPDEVSACLRYAAALGPMLAMVAGLPVLSGAFAVAATDPDVSFAIDVDDESVALSAGTPSGEDRPTLRGSSVDLIEGLSLRVPLPADAPDRWRALVAGIEAAFSV